MRALYLALALALAFIPLPALADPPQANIGTPLSATEFESYASGKTLTYAEGGQVWGTEQYLPGRQVLWAFTGQPCQAGSWHAEDQAICFEYEGETGQNCWLFYHGPSGLVAQFQGGDATTNLSETAQTSTPMQCPGPKVGV